MSTLSRRELLERSMWSAAAAAAATFKPAAALASGPKAGPNEALRVAVVGVKGRGMNHVGDLAAMKDVQVAAIVDIDENIIAPAMKAIEKKGGNKPQYYKDIRKMLEDKSIDAVSIATTNHTHALFSIWSVQAGKHVYVEKPCSHNVWEGRKLVEAARKYGKVVQHGTQSRSNKGMRDLVAYLHEGKLGKVKLARGLCYKSRKSIGTFPDSEPPAGVDYNLWLGPAPERPYNKNRFHYNWHWYWDYGNGDIGNQGVHEMDRARWGLNKSELPKRVLSVGGRVGYVDSGETPNTMVTVMDYGDSQLVFEVRGLETDAVKKCKIGVIFECENGFVVNPNYSGGTAFDKDGQPLQTFGGGGDHFGNWVAAIRSGKSADLNAEILDGHISSAICHLANISVRVGEPMPLQDVKAFDGQDAGAEAFGRMKEHLAQNNVKGDAKVLVGRALAVDTATEKIVGDEAANKLLTREYRAPFVVPEQV
ncbi:MAG TPA: Gfo/Idh/MocA family oxidoreductase [Planctomycetota bacterium]|nr:Gfo/Idh/MocA family oxidoreductase [Planctomycetota bacterium]